jgi:hypothetical protein
MMCQTGYGGSLGEGKAGFGWKLPEAPKESQNGSWREKLQALVIKIIHA